MSVENIQIYQIRKDLDDHKREQDAKFERLAIMVEENTLATKAIAQAVEKHAANTAGVVQLYQDLQAGGRWVRRFKTFLAWLTALGTVGSFIAVCLTYVVDKLGLSP